MTKHHDGFCLWPSQHTRYSVAATPFKKDVVAAVVNSANKHGLKVGFYYCLVMNNATTAYPGVPLHPVDIRNGEKYTQVVEDQKVWEWLGRPVYLPLQIETTLSVRGNERFKSGNWFWYADDHSVASPETLRTYLATARAMQANLLLNAGPSAQGKLRPEDERALKELRHG